MFKVGDLVTAKEYNSYTVTDKGKPCEVVAISQSRIQVKCLWGVGEKYWVYPHKFRLMDKNEIFKPGCKITVESVRKVRGINTEEIVTFIEYSTYGVKVETSLGYYITIQMHSVKGVVKGGLHV
jgi:hypothetical protein